MVKTCRILLFLATALALCSESAHARKPRKKPLPAGTIKLSAKKFGPLPEHLVKRPEHLLTDEQYYQKYIGKNDEKIRSLYLSEWEHQDKELSKSPNTTASYHITPGFDPIPRREDKLRFALAQNALRVRLDTMINSYAADIKDFKGVTEVRQVQQVLQNTLEKVKNQSLRISENNERAGEFRMGYDVITDNSKIEYVKGPVEGGLYHPALVGAITGSKPKFDIASLSLNTNLGSDNPRAGLSLPLHRRWVVTTLEKQLAPTLRAGFSKETPLKAPAYEHIYRFQISYTF
jgi:hypothetical protein